MCRPLFLRRGWHCALSCGLAIRWRAVNGGWVTGGPQAATGHVDPLNHAQTRRRSPPHDTWASQRGLASASWCLPQWGRDASCCARARSAEASGTVGWGGRRHRRVGPGTTAPKRAQAVVVRLGTRRRRQQAAAAAWGIRASAAIRHQLVSGEPPLRSARRSAAAPRSTPSSTAWRRVRARTDIGRTTSGRLQ